MFHASSLSRTHTVNVIYRLIRVRLQHGELGLSSVFLQHDCVRIYVYPRTKEHSKYKLTRALLFEQVNEDK